MKTVNFNGEELRTQFRHITPDRNKNFDEVVTQAFSDAFLSGQVNVHVRDKNVDVRNIAPYVFNAATVCYLEDENRQVKAIGYSFCSSNDQFSKDRGRKIALNRALHELSKNA